MAILALTYSNWNAAPENKTESQTRLLATEFYLRLKPLNELILILKWFMSHFGRDRVLKRSFHLLHTTVRRVWGWIIVYLKLFSHCVKLIVAEVCVMLSVVIISAVWARSQVKSTFTSSSVSSSSRMWVVGFVTELSSSSVPEASLWLRPLTSSCVAAAMISGPFPLSVGGRAAFVIFSASSLYLNQNGRSGRSSFI